MAKTGWFNKNKSGYSVKHESRRHSLAAKGIKTACPKGVKNVSFSGSPTPNFDMVKKGKLKKSEKEKELLNILDRIADDIGVDYVDYRVIENDTARNWMNIGGNPFPKDAKEGTLCALVFDDYEGKDKVYSIVYVIPKEELENAGYIGEVFEN